MSTASGGKFDAALPGEKPGERAPPGKRKRPLVDKVAGPSGAENTKVCSAGSPLQGISKGAAGFLCVWGEFIARCDVYCKPQGWVHIPYPNNWPA